jgi:hypothetical protein
LLQRNPGSNDMVGICASEAIPKASITIKVVSKYPPQVIDFESSD